MYASEVDRLRKTFLSGKTRDVSFRKRQLHAFLRLVQENKGEICKAVKEDLHKHPGETELMELAGVQNEIIHMLNCIDEQSKPEKTSKSLLAILNTVNVRKVPFGVCLIIGAWNYPVLLSLQPMAGAIAAGNCIILKPSEVSPTTAKCFQRLIPKYLDPSCYSVIVAGPEGSSDLVNNHKFDLIFYTGSANIGKLIMQAAAKHLTPVVLELGGMNPCYVDKSCDLDMTAQRITWGKWTNCGQICVSPNYIVCESAIKSELIEKLKSCITKFFGSDPKSSDSYGCIINERHIKRLRGLLEGVDIVHGGEIDENSRYFSPTIVTNVKPDAPIRSEEVFGPILPIYEVSGVDEAIEVMNSGEKSLQLSVFATNRSVIDQVVTQTSSGGVTVNELLMQNNELDLPFGGVGGSGMGRYHGKYSYETFCQLRSYYEGGTPEVINKIKYQPYAESQLKLLRPFIFNRPPLSGTSKFGLQVLALAVLGVLISYVYSIFN